MDRWAPTYCQDFSTIAPEMKPKSSEETSKKQAQNRTELWYNLRHDYFKLW